MSINSGYKYVRRLHFRSMFRLGPIIIRMQTQSYLNKHNDRATLTRGHFVLDTSQLFHARCRFWINGQSWNYARN